MRASRGALRFAVVVAVLQGSLLVALGAVALHSDRLATTARPLVLTMMAVGALWAVVGGYGTWRVRVRGPRLDGSLVTLEPGRTRIGWNAQPRTLALAVSTMLVVSLAGIAWAFWIIGDNLVLPVLFGLVALPLAAVIPDLALRRARACEVAFTEEGVWAVTEDADIQVGWADVSDVSIAARGSERVLRLQVMPGAASLRVQPRPRVVWRPRATSIDVPFGEVNLPPHGLTRVVLTWHEHPAARRDLGTPASIAHAMVVSPGQAPLR